MDHHHRKVAVTALRHHVAHVHLIDGDVAPRTEVAQLHLCLFGLVAADEEAALCLQHQRRVGSLNILECLRHHVAGRAQKPAAVTERRPIDRHHESLTFHVHLLSTPAIAVHVASALQDFLEGQPGSASRP